MNSGIENKFEAIDIHELLPQQEPFVLVDRLLWFDEKTTTTALTIHADNLFIENGILNNCALIENIAQTAAVRLGYYNKYILKVGIQLGFIGSVRDMKILRQVRLGETLTTTITVLEEIMKMTLVDAVILSGKEVIATAKMKIAMSEMEIK